jgi:hypothetical protein
MVRLQDGLRREWVCTFHLERGRRPVLIPFAALSMPEAVLDERDAKGAKDGDRVVVVAKDRRKDESPDDRGRNRKKRRRPTRSDRLAVRVIEVLGPAGEPDSDHRAVVWKHRLARDFPRRARIESEALSDVVAAAEIERRIDLRHLPFVTIDLASSRDHDDAVFAEE